MHTANLILKIDDFERACSTASDEGVLTVTPNKMATTITIQRSAGGYGFNLSRVGNYHVFRHVDESGPAFAAGARVGDSIVAVQHLHFLIFFYCFIFPSHNCTHLSYYFVKL